MQPIDPFIIRVGALATAVIAVITFWRLTWPFVKTAMVVTQIGRQFQNNGGSTLKDVVDAIHNQSATAMLKSEKAEQAAAKAEIAAKNAAEAAVKAEAAADQSVKIAEGQNVVLANIEQKIDSVLSIKHAEIEQGSSPLSKISKGQ